jgi:hypothetical protein
MKVFLSHGQRGLPIARKVAVELAQAGLSVWLAEDEILPGDNWGERVSTALAECDAMVALLTGDAVSEDSVRWEIGYAMGQQTYRERLIPVLVGSEAEVPGDRLPWILERFQHLRLRRPEDAPQLARSIARLLMTPSAPAMAL